MFSRLARKTHETLPFRWPWDTPQLINANRKRDLIVALIIYECVARSYKSHIFLEKAKRREKDGEFVSMQHCVSASALTRYKCSFSLRPEIYTYVFFPTTSTLRNIRTYICLAYYAVGSYSLLRYRSRGNDRATRGLLTPRLIAPRLFIGPVLDTRLISSTPRLSNIFHSYSSIPFVNELLRK